MQHVTMINLSSNELTLIAKSRSIKDYKSKSKEYLLKIPSKQKPKISLFKKKIEEVKKVYNTKIKKNLFAPKIKETKKVFINSRSIMIMMILNTKE